MADRPRRLWFEFGLGTLLLGMAAASMSLMMTAETQSGLYTDSAIAAAIAKHAVEDPERLPSEAKYLVVPNGSTMTRREVFDTLQLDESRTIELPWDGWNSVRYLRWQVSPNYEIECMTADNDSDNAGLDFRDSGAGSTGVQFRPLRQGVLWRH